jgi:RNA-directed DNA polymerase
LRYWADRRRKHTPPLDNATLRLIQEQQGRCPLCGDYLLHAGREPDSPHEWEQWLAATRKAITKHNLVAHTRDAPNELRLVHVYCQRRATSASTDPQLPPTRDAPQLA